METPPPKDIPSLIKEAIDNRIGPFRDAPLQIFQDFWAPCKEVLDCLTRGIQLNETQEKHLAGLIVDYIGKLTYQFLSYTPEPPFSELPERIHSALVLLDFLKAQLGKYETEISKCDTYIQNAKSLKFYYFKETHGQKEPYDYQVVKTEREISSGEIGMVPIAKSVSLQQGPLIWGHDLEQESGVHPPWGTYIRIGQHPPQTCLLVVEHDPYPTDQTVIYAIREDKLIRLYTLQDSDVWYCENLDEVYDNENLRGNHFSIGLQASGLRIANLGCEIGVYVQKREIIDLIQGESRIIRQ